MSLDPPLPASPPRRRAPVPTPIEEPAAAYRLLAMLGLIVTWGLLMQRFGRQGSIYAVMGPFALAVSLAVLALFGRTLRGSLRPTRAAVLGGLAVGVSMTLATYPVYAVLRRLMPGLERDVTVLYAAARQTTLSQALPWVLAIIVAEELLWRGALLCALERRVPPAAALVISIATYAAAQLGTGSWIVMLLALVCGTIWTLQRHFTRSLLSPLLAHLVWTPTVILFYPVAASDDGRAEPVSHTPASTRSAEAGGGGLRFVEDACVDRPRFLARARWRGEPPAGLGQARRGAPRYTGLTPR